MVEGGDSKLQNRIHGCCQPDLGFLVNLRPDPDPQDAGF